jgi:hypothetical protein
MKRTSLIVIAALVASTYGRHATTKAAAPQTFAEHDLAQYADQVLHCYDVDHNDVLDHDEVQGVLRKVVHDDDRCPAVPSDILTQADRSQLEDWFDFSFNLKPLWNSTGNSCNHTEFKEAIEDTRKVLIVAKTQQGKILGGYTAKYTEDENEDGLARHTVDRDAVIFWLNNPADFIIQYNSRVAANPPSVQSYDDDQSIMIGFMSSLWFEQEDGKCVGTYIESHLKGIYYNNEYSLNDLSGTSSGHFNVVKFEAFEVIKL